MNTNVCISNEIKKKLFDYVAAYHTASFITDDPVQFPHRYVNKTDIEISAFIASWLAYGNRKSFIKVLNIIHKDFIPSPTDYIKSKHYQHYENDFSSLYRFYKKNDFFSLCSVLSDIYSNNQSMEDDIKKYINEKTFENVLKYFNIKFQNVNGIPKDNKSACKRLCMLLRWLVRKEGDVDLGIWNILTPSQLIIPVDTHVYQVAKNLNITNRNVVDMKTAEQITKFLLQIFPNDPCLGDFALFGFGVEPTKYYMQK
ncbi:MAG: TIGR02757 family protein [Bacteroidales bacterium]|jgi:uncharacterized protein (TIGR02757 family)|nr:TIGR02757 family protein [Bacteroidales bacterium]